MIKKYLLLLLTPLVVGNVFAQIQPCGTDEMRKQLIAEHPEILQVEADFEKQIEAGMRRIDYGRAAKTTTTDQTNNESFWYDIPVVIHIVHDYNAYSTSAFTGDFIPDDFIFNAVKEWNMVFAMQNGDTADVIAPFKKWIGNPRIRLHLATKDPLGNPTKGITRRRSYLTYSAGQLAKFDGWPPTSYINIWFINRMSPGSNAAAYAHYPSSVGSIPFYDGIISLAEYMNKGSKTIPHELGHVLNLSHVWGDNNQPTVACGDDNVDDTPPTKGHATTGCTAASIYDTTCSRNYFKIYTDDLGNIELVNYPDTNNSQNIMDYTYCDKMFTKGQARRMHITLNSNIAGRNNLWDTMNLVATGAIAPIPDLKPIPDFTVTHITGAGNYLAKNANFTFPGRDVRFTNYTTNDTLTALTWTFTNGAAMPVSTSITNFNSSFSEPGWVTLTMKATGNNSGDSSVTWPRALFVADKTGRSAVDGYFQEFNPDGDREKWPLFNYYNNEFFWQPATVGMYDGNSIMYKGFDERVTATAHPHTGSPKGDFDDMFSIPVDLAGFGSTCNLNFHYTGASRSSLSGSIADSLYIDYTINNGTTWVSLAKLGKGALFNKGAMNTAYTPTSITDWAAKTIPLPAAAITNYTTFRFRYKPGVSAAGVSSGNNFYMDRINFSPWAAEVSTINMDKTSVTIVPNPTKGEAFVLVNDVANTNVHIAVSDITGKIVYATTESVKGKQARIRIPAMAIPVQGIYLIQTITGSLVNTQKLVVY
jgi:hypothetical protein